MDSANAGRTTTTTSTGDFSFTGLTAGTATLTASAASYDDVTASLLINGTNTLNFTLRTTVPWTRTGTGNTVIDLPAYITRLRITGQYSQNSSNFIIWCGSQLVLNELLGTGWNQTSYSGIHQLSAPGCAARIENSTGVAWSLTEQR